MRIETALASPFPERAGLAFGNRSQLREITACAFSSSGGQDALISDEITLVTYCSSETSLISVRPAGVCTRRKAPQNTWRSLRSQWNPIPIVMPSSANAHDAGSDGVSVTSEVNR